MTRGIWDDVPEDGIDNCLINLTKRELQVLNLILDGRSSRDVATSLYCSKRTVDFHLARIYNKLQVTNRVQAMRRATLLGLVNFEPLSETTPTPKSMATIRPERIPALAGAAA